jgi:TRAP transporter TAXI family solute receptor
MKRLHTSTADLAIAAPDVAWQATQGTMKDLPERVAVRTLMGLYSGYLHIVTRNGSGIQSVSDLKGKRVAIGPAGASPEVKGTRLFETHNFSLRDLGSYERLGYPESAKALKDGMVDAFLVDAGLPVPVVAELAATPGMNIRLVSQGDAVPKLAERYPFYFKATIPKNTYQGVAEDVATIGSAVLLVVHERMPNSVAYEITKRILEHTPELLNAHQAAREISLKSAVRGSPIPFHPGAIRYFNERGISVPTA